ncbi:hypothetical protein PHYPSEUDO_007407 [Phytophthora pseudosyringae]|uniref:Glucokinase n=1 Tax=Phytophthora pseudosyringae TaxID=221518 RepID=A0A8T1WNS7_9STRA|nr:hypothetical protein PHYPSEUDO_007407 [Phytophthora pseudosyringae]
MSRKPQDVVDLAAAVLHKLLAQQEHLDLEDLEAVRVGCPGVVENSSIVRVDGALNWRVVPLGRLFGVKLGKRVTVCNDADAAVLAEQWVGTAKNGIKTFIMLTLGTGVGFGALINGQLARGSHNTVEGGHLTRTKKATESQDTIQASLEPSQYAKINRTSRCERW